VVDLLQSLKKGNHSERRVTARQLAKTGARGAVKPLKRMAQGGFYWTGTPFLSRPGYYTIRDQLAAFNALASFRGGAKGEALTALKSLVSEVEVSEPRIRSGQGNGSYNISYKVSFPNIGGRLGSRVYIDYFVLCQMMGYGEISDTILDMSKRHIKREVESPDFAYNAIFKANVAPSRPCNRIYTRIRNLENVCEEST
jgi:hypothetical protein